MVDVCAVWMRKEKPPNFNNAMYCHQEFVSLVGGCTSQSLGTRLRMPVLRNWKVICNSHCIVFFFFSVYSHCDKLIHIEFMMYIVSYNSVQNGLCLMSVNIHVCNVMYTWTRLQWTNKLLDYECGIFNKWAATWQNQQSDGAPSEDSISLGISPVWSFFAVRLLDS